MRSHNALIERLATLRQIRTAAKSQEDEARKEWREANEEIEEILKEIETGEPLRPLIDQAEAAERSRQSARDPAEQAPDSGADFFGRKPRGRKLRERADASVKTVWPAERWTVAEGGGD